MSLGHADVVYGTEGLPVLYEYKLQHVAEHWNISVCICYTGFIQQL